MTKGFVGGGLLTALLLTGCGSSAPAAPASVAAPQSSSAAPASAAPASSAPVASSAAGGASASGAASASASPASSAGAAQQTIAGVTVAPLAQRAKLRLSFNPSIIVYLPLLLAQDKGYFAKAGIDLDVLAYNGSSSTQLPLLAKGDIDVTPVVPNPALFNQAAQGFTDKIVAAMNLPKQGRVSDTWIVVMKDEASQIKDLKDLKGKSVDAGSTGGPMDFLVENALTAGGLDPNKDVTLSHKSKDVTTMLELARNHAVDAMGMTEPVVTQLEKEGMIVRWKTYSDIIPWYQAAQLAASAQYMQANHAALEKFLEVYVLSSREINASNGAWTDDLLRIATSATKMQPDVIKGQGGVPYFGPNATVSLDSLDRVQSFWVDNAQVKQKVDPRQMVDTSVLDEALAKTGKQPES